jgi:hypothetical protein
VTTGFERRLPILAVTHVAAGVVTSFFALVQVHNVFGLVDILIVPWFASALCQAFLLSLWGAASQARPWMRLAGLVIGTAYLEALVPSELRKDVQGISTITIVVTTATLLLVRRLGVRIRRQDDSSQSKRQEPEGLKFSIRGVMIFTALVALLCALARALEGSRNLVLLTFVWALCFVAVGLVSLWAALGDAHPLRPSPAVFVISAVLGAFFAFAVGATREGWCYILLIMLLYPVALLASLFVVRSCGYRLVRRRVPATGLPDSPDGVAQVCGRAAPDH